jgi:hypothetical protein
VQVFNGGNVGSPYPTFEARWSAQLRAKGKIFYNNRHGAPLLLQDCTFSRNTFLWGAVVSRNSTSVVTTELRLAR